MTQQEKLPVDGEVISARDAARLVVGSFRFSRGNETTQFKIISFLAGRFRSNFTPQAFEEARPIVGRAALHYASNPTLHPSVQRGWQDGRSTTELIEDEVKKMTDNFIGRIGNGSHGESDAAELLGQLVERDAAWIPSDDMLTPKNPRPDTYRSNVIQHSLLGRSTESPFFDTLFAAVRDAYDRGVTRNAPLFEDDKSLRMLLRVATAHLAYHPEDSAPLSQAIAASTTEHQIDS